MKLEGDGVLLRIYIGELDKYHRKPLYEAIVLRARKRGLAGATVLRGPMGYGAHSKLQAAKALRLSEDMPIIVEIIDRRQTIADFLPELEKMVGNGLITIERVHIIACRTAENNPEL